MRIGHCHPKPRLVRRLMALLLLLPVCLSAQWDGEQGIRAGNKNQKKV